MSFDERTIALIGEEKNNQLKHKNVIIFGVGGVGGYVAEMLARIGIENLTLVDFDTVSESNINRQIIATNQSVGKLKVDCFKKRIFDINPNCQVDAKPEKLTDENISKFELSKFDFVVDCIDMVSSKIALIKFCYDNNIKIISSMGAGNRYQIPKFEICDINKTENDGLAKVIRAKLRQLGVKKCTVCYTKQDAKKQRVIGSIAYFPASCGITISAYVINCLMGEN